MHADPVFRRNFLIIAAAHVIGVAILFAIERIPSKKNHSDIMWLDGGTIAQTAVTAPEPEEIPAPIEEKKATPIPELPEPEIKTTPTESEIVTESPTPSPTPAATPKPTPSSTPKPTPKPTPKVTPTPKPKTSATPKTSPKPKLTPSASPKPTSKSSPSPANSPGSEANKESAMESKTSANATGKKTMGGGNTETEFGWYHEMIHDRFYTRWVQPTSIISSEQKFITTIKVRIEKDGHISAVNLAKSSGDVVMDESVMAAAQQVTQIDPLPSGLGENFYEININFELNQNKQ